MDVIESMTYCTTSNLLRLTMSRWILCHTHSERPFISLWSPFLNSTDELVSRVKTFQPSETIRFIWLFGTLVMVIIYATNSKTSSKERLMYLKPLRFSNSTRSPSVDTTATLELSRQTKRRSNGLKSSIVTRRMQYPLERKSSESLSNLFICTSTG